MTDLSKVPTQLRRILLDFTLSCLLEKPTDYVEHGCEYFERLRECRKSVQLEKEPSEESFPERRVLANRRKSVVAERYDPSEHSASFVEIRFPKSDADRKRLSESFKGVLIFRSLEREDLMTIMDAMFQRDIEEGEVIIQQGDTEAEHFYLVEEGIFEASVHDGQKSNVVKMYNNNGSFGELALLHNTCRAATIRAVTEGKLWVLDRATFKRIVLRSAYLKRERYKKLIDSVEFLQELTNYAKLDLADSLAPLYFFDGQTIFTQGDTADGMYFVETGGVQLVLSHQVHGNVLVKELEPGGYLGELALLTHNRRALTAIAQGETKLAFLDKTTFERLLGPCADVLTKNFQNYESQMVDAVGSATSVYFRNDSSDDNSY